MPNTYTLLETITVGAAGASSVTFNSIPQTGYTDLVIKYSARGTGSALNFENVQVQFNGVGGTAYSDRNVYGTNSAAASAANSSGASTFLQYMTGVNATASTFGNGEIYIPNFTSANAKSYSADTVSENNSATAAITSLTAGISTNTAAITSVKLTANTSSFAQHSTFSLYGVSALGTTPTKAPKATGGSIIQTDGTYWYHAFLSSGTFTPATALSCDVLVVAGGGGGGAGVTGFGGGGGSGGAFYATSQSIGTSAQTVTVGAGGAVQTSGSNSIFGSLTTAIGGGRGGDYNQTGTNGGAGGGGGEPQAGGSSTQTGTGGTGYGFGGGSAVGGSGGGGGGGGGIGAAGVNAGVGGAGLNTWSSWLSTTGLGVSGYIAGGGGGSVDAQSVRSGGAGGGGQGAKNTVTAAVAGTANTGSGGGGGVVSTAGAAGGSGLVIVRYLA